MKAKEKKQVVHKPVMVDSVLDFLGLTSFAPLKITNRPVIIDATLGAGGHSKEIICRGGYVLGIDDDKEMLSKANEVLKKACPSPMSHRGLFKLAQGNFRNIDTIAESEGINHVDGVLFDLGISAFHLLNDDRGFSFQNPDVSLDMRLNTDNQGVTAFDLLNGLPEDKLVRMFMTTMDFKDSRRLADNIVKDRIVKKIISVGDFVAVVKKSIRQSGKINVATKPMLAVRIAVNSELANLETALPKAFDLLPKGGRLVVISFHSGEDRLVKQIFKRLSQWGNILTKKPVIPDESELIDNPMARSAKLRAIEKN